MSNNWRVAFAKMQKQLKDLNSYVECHDWKNAKHIANLLKFNLTFDVAYEQEHINQLKQCAKKGE